MSLTLSPDWSQNSVNHQIHHQFFHQTLWRSYMCHAAQILSKPQVTWCSGFTTSRKWLQCISLQCTAVYVAKDCTKQHLHYFLLGKHHHVHFLICVGQENQQFRQHDNICLPITTSRRINPSTYLVYQEPMVVVDWGKDQHPGNCLRPYPVNKWNDILCKYNLNLVFLVAPPSKF